MVSPKPPIHPTPDLFNSKTDATAAVASWLRHLTYRPLLLVGGFWLVLVALAAISYSRLMDIGMAPTGAETAPTASTPGNSQADATPRPQDGAGLSQGGGMSVGAIGLMAGLCALGCVGVAHQTHAAARPRPRRQLKPTESPTPRPTRLKPYVPKAPQPDLAPTVSAISPPPSEAVSPTTAAEIIPSQTSHPLDWPEGSLADEVDLRQRRSLSSLL